MWIEAAAGGNADSELEVPEAAQAPALALAPAPVMDAGLIRAFDGLPEDLRQSMERFAEMSEAGSRLKLPPFVTPKQRKAVHLWAEARALGHRSFGWASRRRLHLSKAGTRDTDTAHEAGAQPEEAFDWSAWAESDQGEDDWANDQDSDDEADGAW